MEIIYVKDISVILGKSESAIRSALARNVDWIPPHFRLGKKYAWVRKDVDKWLSERANEPKQE